MLILALAATLLLYVIYSDIRFRTIPNTIIIGLTLLFIPLAFFSELDPIVHLLTFSLTFIVAFLLFHQGWLGGGDAKLIAVIALWVGPNGIWPFLLAMTLGGVFVAIGLIIVHAKRTKSVNNWRNLKLPYGVAIAVAAIVIIGQQYLPPALILIKGA